MYWLQIRSILYIYACAGVNFDPRIPEKQSYYEYVHVQQRCSANNEAKLHGAVDKVAKITVSDQEIHNIDSYSLILIYVYCRSGRALGEK